MPAEGGGIDLVGDIVLLSRRAMASASAWAPTRILPRQLHPRQRRQYGTLFGLRLARSVSTLSTWAAAPAPLQERHIGEADRRRKFEAFMASKNALPASSIAPLRS